MEDVGGFFEQYQFLSCYVYKEEVKRSRVSRIDLDFLARERGTECVFNFLFLLRICRYETIWLLDEKGGKLLEVGERVVEPAYRHSHRWEKFTHSYRANTTKDALLFLRKKGEIDKVFYALSFSKIKGELVLYKLPRDFSLSQWAKEQMTSALETVQTDKKDFGFEERKLKENALGFEDE